jgi:hypothetical protein
MKARHPDNSLVDRIYEAAFIPENWSDVLDSSSQSIDADGAPAFYIEGHAFAFHRIPEDPGYRQGLQRRRLGQPQHARRTPAGGLP